jgi:DNA-binding transcriptional regulator YhcF (GntR family)
MLSQAPEHPKRIKSKMTPRLTRNPKPKREHSNHAQPTKVSLPAAALLSFLKETRGITNWSVRDFAKTLSLNPAAAKEALAILEMQGYVKSPGPNEYMTTPAGETVSGSKMPRYSRETVEQSLASFADHLKRVNQDSSAEYKIADAVTFGDFLSGRARVQSADVGIRLEPRNLTAHHPHWASEHDKQEAFLKHLRGRTLLVNLHPYAEWMSARTHRKLL